MDFKKRKDFTPKKEDSTFTKRRKSKSINEELFPDKFVCFFVSLEAVPRRCSVKKVFLEISENSRENTCARVSFSIKLQAIGLQLYEKRNSGTGVFL